jgi:hypothetical protein
VEGLKFPKEFKKQTLYLSKEIGEIFKKDFENRIAYEICGILCKL